MTRRYVASAEDARAIIDAPDGEFIRLVERHRTTHLFWCAPPITRSLKYDRMRAEAMLSSARLTLESRILRRIPVRGGYYSFRFGHRALRRGLGDSCLFDFRAHY